MTGYSKTPLIRKLGYKPNFRIKLINPPDDFIRLLDTLPDGIDWQAKNNLDMIHYFINNLNELESLFPQLPSLLKKNGMIWISWYKKSARLATELNENIIRDTGLAIGLVDVKVCAIDEKWSGLKFVIPLVDR